MKQLHALVTHIRTRARSVIHFFSYGMWHMHLRHKPRLLAFAVKVLRVTVLSVREFQRDKCQLRASALTFYTVLSIVPVLAMAFGIAKGFNLDQRLKDNILERFELHESLVTNITEEIVWPDENAEDYRAARADVYRIAHTNIAREVIPLPRADGSEITPTHLANADIVGRILEFAENALQTTHSGVITGISVFILLWMVVKVLSQIELSMNAVWGVTKSRHIGRKFTDYLSLMLICPLLIIVAGSLTVAIRAHLQAAADHVVLFGAVAPTLFGIFRLAPYFMVWFLFSFIYIFMPNTRVKLPAGIVAGIIAGTLYQLVQWVYITFQVGVSKYGAIYGSFAALPLFLIWLQLSWVVVLFGAEFSFAYQNVETYEFEDECKKASPSFRVRIALLIAHSIVTRFARGDTPPKPEELSSTLDIPMRLLRALLDQLVNAHIVRETLPHEYENPGYVPARDIHSLTIASVITALAHTGTNTIPVADTPALERICHALKQQEKTLLHSPDDIPLSQI